MRKQRIRDTLYPAQGSYKMNGITVAAGTDGGLEVSDAQLERSARRHRTGDAAAPDDVHSPSMRNDEGLRATSVRGPEISAK
jgi:hypothetical protein